MSSSTTLQRHQAVAVASRHEVPPGELYPIADLPKRRWMPRRGGKPLSRYTIVRWAIVGKAGRKLRTILIGGIRCTCDEWAMEFFEALTNGERTKAMSQRQTASDHAAAEAELDKLGIG